MCILAASAGAAGAAQQSDSVTNTVTRPLGTTIGSKSLLDLKVGSLLEVAVLPDQLVSTIDDVKSTKKAQSSLCLATIKSGVAAIDSLDSALPCFNAANDGQQTVKGSALDLSTGSLQLPLVGGANAIDIKVVEHLLSAKLDNLGAVAGVGEILTRVNVAGLVKVELIKDDVVGNALATQADGVRSLKVEGGIKLLTLGDLLGLKSADLNGLPLGVLDKLADLLKLQVPGVGSDTDVVKAVTEILASIEAIKSVTTTDASAADKITRDVASVAGPVNSLAGAIPDLPVTKTKTLPTDSLLGLQVDETLAGLQSSLANVLNGLLGAVKAAADTPLVEVTGFNLDASTLAVANLADSKALANVELGKVKVLGTEILDANQLKGLVDTLNGILSVADIVGIKLELLEENAKVQAIDGYNVAESIASVLHLNVNPLGLFDGNGGLLSGLTAASAARGAGLPTGSVSTAALPANLLGLLSAPGGGLLDLRVAPVTSRSEFKAAAVTTGAPTTPGQPDSPVTVNQLPRTGAENNLFAAAAVVLMLLSLGIRRSLRRAEAITQ